MSTERITTPEAWSLVKEIAWTVRSLPSAERERVIADRLDEEHLRERVRKLLRAIDDVGDRFERPAIETLSSTGTVRGEDGWGDAPSLVGRALGAYSVLRRIGTGGMGAVYEGARHDGAFSQRVAIKTLWRGADSDVLSQRFRSERRILATLEHPNIARLIDGGATVEGTPYLVMEFVDGTPIDRYCDERALSVAHRLDLFRQACAAVQHAHSNLVVHRDLKPSNILVAHDGQVKLLDFGVAKLLDDPRSEGTLTGAGLLPFTRAYAAPEQLRGDAPSTATDVFALGAVLYALLCGRPPFDTGPAQRPPSPRPPSTYATDDAARARGMIDAARLRRALHGDLDAIALMALRPEPARRYPTVDALSEDVRRYLRGDRVVARPDTLRYRARVFVRRRRTASVAFAVAAAALLAGAGIALWEAHDTRLEAERSERIAGFMTGMFGAPSGHTGSSFMRFGPRGNIAMLLDAARARVRDEFPDDPKIRARLYAAIGASYTAQSRMHDAALVLDSARILARASYGPESDVFAEASVDAADAAIHRAPPRVAAAYAREALDALRGRELRSAALYARALDALATSEVLAGNVNHGAVLARAAIAADLHATRAPTLTRAWALRLLAATTELNGDERGADSIAAHAVACADSLGETYSLERLDALLQRSITQTALGHPAVAESLLAGALDAARVGYGNQSREAALAMSLLSIRLRDRGDTARANALADSALANIDALSDANANAISTATGAAIYEAESEHRYAAMAELAHHVYDRATALESPPVQAYASVYEGVARFYAGDVAAAEATLRRGLAAHGREPLPRYFQTALRVPLALTLAREQRIPEADSVVALLPPAEATALRRMIHPAAARH